MHELLVEESINDINPPNFNLIATEFKFVAFACFYHIV